MARVYSLQGTSAWLVAFSEQSPGSWVAHGNLLNKPLAGPGAVSHPPAPLEQFCHWALVLLSLHHVGGKAYVNPSRSGSSGPCLAV